MASGVGRFSCMGEDVLPLQRRGMPLWAALHHQYLEYAEESRKLCEAAAEWLTDAPRT